MIEKMDRFTTLGFRPIGEWKLAGLNLVCELVEKDPRGNFIYAFVMGQAIMFMEYSRTPLEARMDAYRHTDHRYAGTFQPMNKRLREKILAALEDGEVVEIWAFYPGEMEYEGFRVDLAAGLAEGLVKEFKPGWSG